jgi:hypothetical protein
MSLSEELVTDSIYDDDPIVFCAIEWSLQDVYTVLQEKEISVTRSQLEDIAETLRKQLNEQSTAEGWLIIETLIMDAVKECV